MNNFLDKIQFKQIHTVALDANPNAENFYKSFGFETVGQRESSLKERYLPIMKWRIEKTHR